MRIDVSIPDLAKVMQAEITAGERAAKLAMVEATKRSKEDWRQQIVAAGLGKRLSRSIRADVYPKGITSLNAAGFVYAKSPKIIEAHIKGATIRSKNGFFLAIPTPAAGKGRGGARLTPGEWERRRGIRLRFIYRRTGPSLLVAEKARINARGTAVASRAKTGRGQVTAPIFILVPQVKLKARIDLQKALRAGEAVFYNDFADYWK